MKNLENDLNVVYSLDKSRAVDKKYLDDYFYNKIKRDNEKIASVYIIDELIQSFFRDYTLDIYNLEKPIESNESLLKEYPNNKPVYQMLLSGWFTKKDILSYIEDSDKGIELFRNFKNVTDVSGYYKYTREMNAIYKSFSNIETIQDFLYACSKYALYRLLGDIAVCHYLGLRKDFNTSMFQSDGVDPSFERMVKPYKLHHKTMWYTELNKNIKGIVYPEMSKEWVFKDEAPWLDSYLENVYDKPLLLVLVVKTLIKIVNQEIEFDDIFCKLILKLSYGCGYKLFKESFHKTSLWYVKQKRIITVHPETYVIKELLKVNNMNMSSKEINEYFKKLVRG